MSGQYLVKWFDKKSRRFAGQVVAHNMSDAIEVMEHYQGRFTVLIEPHYAKPEVTYTHTSTGT